MKAQTHPDPGLIERFLLQQTSEGENPPIVRHLLGQCPRCQSVVRRVLYESDLPLAQLLLRVGKGAQV